MAAPCSLAMTRNGRHVVVRQADEVHVIDVLGPGPRRRFATGPGDVLACVGDEAWWTDDRGGLYRLALSGDEEPAVDARFGGRIGSVVTAGEGAIVTGVDRTWLVEPSGALVIDVEPETRVLAALGRRVVESHGHAMALRTIGRRDAVAMGGLPGVALAARFVLAGRAVAVWARGSDGDALVVSTTSGKLIHRIATPALRACAFAEDANLAIAASEDGLGVFDLRYGQVRTAPFGEPVHAVEIDRLGRRVAVAGDTVAWFSLEELFAGRSVVVDEPSVAEILPALPSPLRVELEPPREAEPDLVPLALAPASAPIVLVPVPEGVLPYAQPGEHISAILDVVAARTALVIAEGWHSGRTSHDRDTDLPCEREVLGLLGEDVGLAADALRRARSRLAERAHELAARTNASLVAGLVLPFHDVAREYGLSATATQILACAVAPRLRSHIARLYGILDGLAGRAACADHLLDALVEVEPGGDLASELAPEAPLLRAGLIRLQPCPDRVDVLVDQVLIDRLRGTHRAVDISDATTRRRSDRTLAEIVAPAQVKRTLVLALADRDDARPARIVVRGRRGSGRHTLVAALAAQVGRSIAAIDATRLPRGAGIGPALALELVRANLAGCVPVVSGLEAMERADGDSRLQIQTVLRRHPGPVAVRATPDADLPIDPDRVEVVLPALSLGQRASVWQTALAARRLDVSDDAIATLATKFLLGPGAIERVVDQVARRAVRSDVAVAVLVDEVARQHIASRLERVATRITRLADWDQVRLDEDMLDSVRALIGRVRHQRTVYEDWGYERRITTARGLTALFYGAPGTGKTLVAGLIGRELGLDVWRIDLARVTSKWLGETEKNLAEVFEAAEEGQVLLLFDEADSLFGKRSEVKSSNDRYANLEVNYLLQRLDSFEGVAILTTNLEGSIDGAFKRRLSTRLYFPFPDEELRAELWAAHVPPGVPCAGALDFEDLARRYPLSGGYIRNSALRAAFLAAQERRPLSQDHLVRAVQLEYRELGKLSSSGRIE
jgi:DNA replication protein DnaC